MPLKIVAHRRRRQGRTNYRKRLDLLKSRNVRLVVRGSSKNMYCQLVEYNKNGDVVIASSSSKELSKFGWTASNGTGNIPAAYLTGLLCGSKTKDKSIKVILDIGVAQSSKGSKLYAALKGAIDGGLDVAHSNEAFPTDDRISGKHIADYAAKIKKEKPVKYKSIFSGYLDNKINPEDIPKVFESAKAKILSSGK